MTSSADPTFELVSRLVEQSNGGQENASVLNSLIHEELANISSSIGPWTSSPCMLQDLGNFLHRATKMVSYLANDLVHGEHLMHYAKDRVDDMIKETDFSDLDNLEYLTQKHALLKTFAEQLQKTTQLFEAQWVRSAQPPFGQSQRDESFPVPCRDGKASESPSSSSSSDDGSVTTTLSHYSTSSQHGLVEAAIYSSYHPQRQHAMIESAASHHERTEQQDYLRARVLDLLDSVGQRGTGNHTCPYELHCTKGGIRNERLFVFERNSAFRAHLQKHVRLFVCDMPNCSAKGGFARSDQLRRHQISVPHNKPA